MPIAVIVEDITLRTDDLTLDEAIWVETETGTSWLRINPFASAAHCRALMIVALMRGERSEEEARKVAGAYTVGEAVDAVSVVDDDLPATFVNGVPDPNPEGAPATSGSSGAPDASDGPLT